MLNKKVVIIREMWEEGLVEYESVAVGVNDKEYKDAVAHPWKFLSGAVRHFLKRIQIISFRMVEMFTVADIESDEEGVFEECREYSAFADTLIITDKVGNIRIYECQILETIRADIRGAERLERLAWLIPYVKQFRVLDKLNMLVSNDLSVMFKAVEVTV